MSTELRATGRRSGSGLIPILILLLIGSLIAGTLLHYSSASIHLTRRALDYQRATLIAEAGLDYGVMRARDVLLQYGLAGHITAEYLQYLLDAIPPPPVLDGSYLYTTGGGERTFWIDVDGPPVIDQVIPDGPSAGQTGTYQSFTITCGVRNPETGVRAVVRQRLQAVSTFMVRYGVFYMEDLEILPGPAMTFAGRVHSNADLYLGGPLTFLERLTSVGHVYHHRKDSSAVHGEARIATPDGNLLSMRLPNGTFLDSRSSNWLADSTLRWREQIRTRAHGVPRLSPPIDPTDVPHSLIERPIPEHEPGYLEATEREKFANKAALTLHVHNNGTLSAWDRHGDAVNLPRATLRPTNQTVDGQPLYLKNNGGQYRFLTNGVYQVENRFYDAREQTSVAPVDIYLDQLLLSYSELYSGASNEAEDGSGIVFITRDPPAGESARPVVRIRNGWELFEGLGLSLVSDLPVYVEGEFNRGDADGTTLVPAMVAGDAVTFLSSNWQDARSRQAANDRAATDTIYNLVVMTGNTRTSTGAYNGGLENVLRFLENWSGRTVRQRGSIICMWQSQIANGRWYHGNRPSSPVQRFIYNAPRRDWGYDPLYLRNTPPGIPRLFGVEETAWSRENWDVFEDEDEDEGEGRGRGRGTWNESDERGSGNEGVGRGRWSRDED